MSLLATGSLGCSRARKSGRPACQSRSGQRPPHQESPGYGASVWSCQSAPGPGSCRSTRCRSRLTANEPVLPCALLNPNSERSGCQEDRSPLQRVRHLHSTPQRRLRRSQPRLSSALDTPLSRIPQCTNYFTFVGVQTRRRRAAASFAQPPPARAPFETPDDHGKVAETLALVAYLTLREPWASSLQRQ